MSLSDRAQRGRSVYAASSTRSRYLPSDTLVKDWEFFNIVQSVWDAVLPLPLNTPPSISTVRALRLCTMAPGRNHRAGLSLAELFRRFPDNAAAEAWFVKSRWPNGIACHHCGSINVATGSPVSGIGPPNGCTPQS